MKASCYFMVWMIVLCMTESSSAQKKDEPLLFARQNLVAWCIVPFDKMKRTPAQRAAMLKSLGITQLAWDWRDEHLAVMDEEIRTLRESNIRLSAVWFWVNGGPDGSLDKANEFILNTLKKNGVK